MNWDYIRQVGSVRWLMRTAKRQFSKHVLVRDNHLRLPTGLVMILPRTSASASEVYVTGANIDWGAEILFAEFAERDCDALDIGAHVGYYAMYLAPLMRRVYAFEPDARNLAGLETNAGIAGNIEVVRQAVSSYTGRARFSLGGDSSVSSLERIGDNAIEVAVTTVDDFLAVHPGIAPALIKTDLEGHDLEGLRGMRRTIKQFQPLILTECNEAAELFALTAEAGYTIFGLVRSRAQDKPMLRRLDARDFGEVHFKMLFLVPRRLRPAFEERMLKT